jgi:competence protein ComEC
VRPRHDARLVLGALAAYAAALSVLSGVASAWWWVGAAGAVLAIAAVRRGVRGPRGASGATWLACAAVLAVVASAHVVDAARWSGGIGSVVGAGGSIGFEGTVVGEPQPIGMQRYGAEDERWKVVVAVSRWMDEAGARHPARAQVVVLSGEAWSELGHGDHVAATGKLSAAPPGRPVALAWDATLSSHRAATGGAAAVAHLRDAFRRDAGPLPPAVRGLTIGMVIGDTSQMGERQVGEMRVVGLTHLTAVSGSHFAAIALALGLLVRALGWRRPVRVLLLAAVMACFVALVFPGASVVRAAWMGGVIVVALAWGRPSQALPALASAVIGLLLVDPYLSLSYGFALSVLATAAIALWSPILAEHLCRFFTPTLARVVAVPVAAQVACAPVIVLLNPGLGPYAVPANLIAVPCAAMTTIVGLVGVLASAASPALGHVLAVAASLPAWPIAWAARGFANAPYAWLPWPSGPVGALLAAVCSGALIAATSARRVVGWVRIAAVVAVFSVVAASPPLRLALASGAWTPPAQWRIAVCDVGQGDAVLLRTGEHEAIVIDVGPRGAAGLECLRAHSVTRVPLLILTHPHADHDGAIREVLAAIHVERAWVSGAAWDPASDRAVTALIAAGVPVSTPSSGTAVSVGWVRLAVWHEARALTSTSAEVNDSSLVTWGEADGVTFLELGDLQAKGQSTLDGVPGLARRVDIVKVAHHGSASQDPGLADSLAARVAAVSVGAGNPYGHPSPGTIDEYRQTGAAVLRTDECGDVDIERGGVVAVSAACPSAVAGWGHGATGRSTDGSAGMGPGVLCASRSGGGPRAGARRAGDSRHHRGRPIDRGDRLRDQTLGRELRPRGPPSRDEP